MKGRPRAEYDVKQFVDLIGLGCGADEICWWFRDEKGKPANIDTISRWCRRTFGQTFQEFRVQNGAMALKIKVRRNQLKLSEKSAAMAIFLGKNYLGQTDNPVVGDDSEVVQRANLQVQTIAEQLAKAVPSQSIEDLLSETEGGDSE